MNIEQLYDYCLSKKGVTEHFPFNKVTLVFKVMGKMFIMVGLDRWEEGRSHIVLKLDPEQAIELRETYESIIGGFQQGKKATARFVRTKHWNTVIANQEVEDSLIFKLIDDAYDIVVKGLTKKLQKELKSL